MRTQQTQSSGDLVSQDTKHIPVLLQEVISVLKIGKDDIVFDGTLGGAGHTFAISKLLSDKGVLIGTDLNSKALKIAKKRLNEVAPKLILEHNNFQNIKSILKKHSIKNIDKALLDLGWSSDHLDSKKGFSFRNNEPLDMRLGDMESELTAKDIVNTWKEETLADIFFYWGNERYARKIAQEIIKARQTSEIQTTSDLVQIIKKSVPAYYKKKRIHFATKVFQALRIAVNSELEVAKNGIREIVDVLNPTGRLAVISFHSGEDRLVKKLFKEFEKNKIGKSVFKKPITASEEELKNNPRARSAKLRVFEKYE